jgi:sugar O-acyltransferase (sialic acid O-acetyltransferase NeuD family)
MKDIVVFGLGYHPHSVIDIAQTTGKFQVRGLIDRTKTGVSFGVDIVDKDFIWASGLKSGVVAWNDNFSRGEVVAEILRDVPDFEFVTLIHPSAQIARDVEIGAGTVIMPGAIINAGVRIGRHAIINTKASVDHDSQLGDFSCISPGATICGLVQVGDYSTVSAGATVIHRKKIGQHTVIGAGSTVVKDIPDHVVAFGSPCRVVRLRAAADKYL